MRFRLRTLVALTAIAPPLIAGLWFYTDELWLLFALFALPGLFVLWLWVFVIWPELIAVALADLFSKKQS